MKNWIALNSSNIVSYSQKAGKNGRLYISRIIEKNENGQVVRDAKFNEKNVMKQLRTNFADGSGYHVLKDHGSYVSETLFLRDEKGKFVEEFTRKEKLKNDNYLDIQA